MSGLITYSGQKVSVNLEHSFQYQAAYIGRNYNHQ